MGIHSMLDAGIKAQTAAQIKQAQNNFLHSEIIRELVRRPGLVLGTEPPWLLLPPWEVRQAAAKWPSVLMTMLPPEGADMASHQMGERVDLRLGRHPLCASAGPEELS